MREYLQDPLRDAQQPYFTVTEVSVLNFKSAKCICYQLTFDFQTVHGVFVLQRKWLMGRHE